jgi:hypothetical protein
MTHGLQQIMLQPKMSALFKNMNINVKSSEFETQKIEEKKSNKPHVKGLTFV